MYKPVKREKVRLHAIALYIISWLLVLSFSFSMLPSYGPNVAFSGAVAAGVGFWLYGKKCRLILVFVWTLYHFLVCNAYNGLYSLYQYTLFPTIVIILLAWLVSEMRHNHDSLRATNQQLDSIVLARTRDLEQLVEKMIERREAIRSEQGESLHNNVGQNLTGIRLYCDSLAERKGTLNNTVLNSTHSIRSTISSIHELVRKAAKVLFPVQIEKIGLLSAISNLSAALERSHNAKFTIKTNTDHFNISSALSLQLYRIFEETIQRIIDHDGAKNFHVVLASYTGECCLEISCDRNLNVSIFDKNVDIQIIKFRVSKLAGKMWVSKPDSGSSKIHYSIPNTGYEKTAKQ